MDKAQALSHFKENYLEPKSTEKMEQVMNYFKDHKDELVPGFVESFRQICLKIKEMQQEGKKDKIGYITFSLFRSNIKNRNYIYVIDAYNEEWFYDTVECRAEYDASWAYVFLDQFQNELEDKRRLYIDKITLDEIDTFRLGEIGIYNDEIINLARYAMPKALELKEYDEILKHDVLEVRVGEYKGISQVVYREDTREKDAEEIREWLEKKIEGEYAYEVLRNLDLSNGDYEGIDLMYAQLSGSDFSGSNMKSCSFIGADLKECKFIEADLTGAVLSDCNLKNAAIRDSVFEEVSGGEISFENAKFENVSMQNADISFANMNDAELMDVDFSSADLFGTSFKHTIIENVIFKDAKLENVDFSEAIFINADFEGAYMEETIFSAKDIANLCLTEEQKKSIVTR